MWFQDFGPGLILAFLCVGHPRSLEQCWAVSLFHHILDRGVERMNLQICSAWFTLFVYTLRMHKEIKKNFYHANHLFTIILPWIMWGLRRCSRSCLTNCWEAGILQMRGLLFCRRAHSGFTTSHHRATTDSALPARNQGKRISHFWTHRAVVANKVLTSVC